MAKPFRTLVFIGRFQPVHNGHLHVINEALKEADRVLVLIGSANVARSPRDPFTAMERRMMLLRSVAEPHRVLVDFIEDHPYNDDAWIAEVQSIIADYGRAGSLGLVGFSKDSTSYYLKLFPGMESVNIPSQWGMLNSTDIRKMYFEGPIIPDKTFIPTAVADFLRDFYLLPEYKWLVKEHIFYRDYDPKKYPVQVITADAVAIQSGHVLLVERAASPGKGLLALPGGHVNTDETFQQAAIRELIEETGISERGPKHMPPAVLASYIRDRKVFDAPKRSQRGRVVTEAFLFQFPQKEKLYWVKGGDDASSAAWHPLGNLDPTKMFEDHYAIIETMTKGAVS